MTRRRKGSWPTVQPSSAGTNSQRTLGQEEHGVFVTAHERRGVAMSDAIIASDGGEEALLVPLNAFLELVNGRVVQVAHVLLEFEV